MHKEWFSEDKAPPSSAWRTLPSLAEEAGAARLAQAAQAVGAPSARKAAKESGPYLLDDKIALRLKLQGITLGAHGEVKALSPPRWKEIERKEVSGEIVAIQLSAAAQKRLETFVRIHGKRPRTASEVAEIARHFFYEDSIKVAVAR